MRWHTAASGSAERASQRYHYCTMLHIAYCSVLMPYQHLRFIFPWGLRCQVDYTSRCVVLGLHLLGPLISMALIDASAVPSRSKATLLMNGEALLGV